MNNKELAELIQKQLVEQPMKTWGIPYIPNVKDMVPLNFTCINKKRLALLEELERACRWEQLYHKAFSKLIENRKCTDSSYYQQFNQLNERLSKALQRIIRILEKLNVK